MSEVSAMSLNFISIPSWGLGVGLYVPLGPAVVLKLSRDLTVSHPLALARVWLETAHDEL